MAEELATLAALRYAPTPPQNAVAATAAVSLRAKAALPRDTLAYDVASAADAYAAAMIAFVVPLDRAFAPPGGDMRDDDDARDCVVRNGFEP